MITIAVLTREKTHFDTLITQYNRLPVHFHWFESADRFLQSQNVDQWQIVWVIGKSMDWVMESLARLNEQNISIPLVCSAPEPKQDQRQLFWQLNVKEIIPWPMHRLEMEYMLKGYNEMLSDNTTREEYVFQGSLEIINGVDLLRAFTKATDTGVLYFHWGERKGRIEFKKGQIVNAIYRQMDPLTAVLILTSWKHGFVFFKDDQYVSKRSIMLTNEQIFTECQDYQNEYHKLLAGFDDLSGRFYPHPELNFEEFGPSERKILRDMRKGKLIPEMVENYEGDVNFILKKLKNWADQQFILPEEQYRQIRQQLEEQENTSAIKRLMQKLFAKKEVGGAPIVQKNKKQNAPQALQYCFSDRLLLEKVKNKLEELF